jgi:hypothetical protein
MLQARENSESRHSRAEPAPAKAWGGNPRLRFLLQWIPVCAGMMNAVLSETGINQRFL